MRFWQPPHRVEALHSDGAGSHLLSSACCGQGALATVSVDPAMFTAADARQLQLLGDVARGR